MTTSLWDDSLHDTASRILDAATELFAAQGFKGTTVKEITERCRITQAALYLYFPSKDALLAELIRVAHGELARRLDEADQRLDATTDPRLRLRALVGALVEYGTECTLIARVADRDWRALSEPHRTAVAALRRDVRQRFEGAVSQCLDHNQFELAPGTAEQVGDYRTRLVATCIIDMALGVAGWYDGSFSLPTAALVASYQDLVLAMASGRARTPRINGSKQRSR